MHYNFFIVWIIFADQPVSEWFLVAVKSITRKCKKKQKSKHDAQHQRWKVMNYIYSRYCNWVAFLCTSTF